MYSQRGYRIYTFDGICSRYGFRLFVHSSDSSNDFALPFLHILAYHFQRLAQTRSLPTLFVYYAITLYRLFNAQNPRFDHITTGL